MCLLFLGYDMQRQTPTCDLFPIYSNEFCVSQILGEMYPLKIFLLILYVKQANPLTCLKSYILDVLGKIRRIDTIALLLFMDYKVFTLALTKGL